MVPYITPHLYLNHYLKRVLGFIDTMAIYTYTNENSEAEKG